MAETTNEYDVLIDTIRNLGFNATLRTHKNGPDDVVCSSSPGSGTSFFVRRNGEWELGTWVGTMYRIAPTADPIQIIVQCLEHRGGIGCGDLDELLVKSLGLIAFPNEALQSLAPDEESALLMQVREACDSRHPDSLRSVMELMNQVVVPDEGQNDAMDETVDSILGMASVLPDKRLFALFLLTRFGRRARRATHWALSLLDEHPLEAILCLGAVAPNDPVVVGTLCKLTRNTKDNDLKVQVVRAIGKGNSPEVREVLLEAISDPNDELVLWGLCQLSADDLEAYDRVLALKESLNQRVMLRACLLLCEFGERALRDLPSLLHSDFPIVQAHASRALGEIGVRAKSAIPTLKKVAERKDWVGDVAKTSISQIAVFEKEAPDRNTTKKHQTLDKHHRRNARHSGF